MNKQYSKNQIDLSYDKKNLMARLYKLDPIKYEKTLDDLIRKKNLLERYSENVQNPFAILIEKIHAIKSYGIKYGKRVYAGYADERKVIGRREKESERGSFYYADGHSFSNYTNALPEIYNNQIICGDSEEILSLFPENCIDLIITSPPYNFGLEYTSSEDSAHWEAYLDKLFRIFSHGIRVLKYGGRFIVNVQPLFSDYIPLHHIISSFFMSQKMIWKGEILWEKNNYNCKYTSWGSWKSPSSPYLKYTWEFIEIFCKGTLKKNGKSPEAEKIVPLFIEALVRKGDFISVHRLFSVFRQKFPKSVFMPRLFYIEGIALAKEEKFQQAVIAFSSALEGGVSSTLDSLAKINTEAICKQLTIEEFNTLSSIPLSLSLLEIVKYSEIQKLFSIGQFVKVQGLAEEFRKMFPRSRFDYFLRDLIAQAREKQRGTIQIGVLAPISGDEAEIGKSVALGVQLAFDQFDNMPPGLTLKTIVLDTKGSMIETARKTKELIDDHRVPVIIGPVLSHTATVTAAMLIGKQAVMISPTATDDGIAGLSKNVFQMNVTLGILGRKVARYAIENLNIKEFAILAPNSSYGTVMAENFKDELKKQNVELVGEVYYEEGANDFTPEFMNLRYQLLTKHLEKLSIEKGTDLKGKISRSDSLKYLDSTLAVGGLFMPGDAEDVVMLAPQTAFHRIRTQILGSNGWHNQKVIQDGKQYVTNAIISTSFETDQSTGEWQNFKKVFRNRYNIEPDRIAALGYDAASLILKIIREVGDDPVKIGEALRKVQGFKGLAGNVSFDRQNGANTEASIFKISPSGFLRLQ